MNMLLVVALFVAAALATDFERIVKIVNKAETTWKAQMPKDAEKYISSLGSLVEENTAPVKIQNVAADIPKEFDPIKQWPNCRAILSEIRDQSTCGSCWAFGAVEAATDRLCIATNGTNTKRLSEEDMLTCCTTCGMGCNGGYPQMAWNYLARTGISSGGPYGDTTRCNAYTFPKCDHHVDGKYGPCGDTKPTPKCVKTCQDTYPVSYADDKVYFNNPYSIPRDIAQLQTELMTHGPIEVSFTVYEDFVTYAGGVYKYTTGKRLGGHAVKLVGWGEDNGVKYWKVANSWNEGWGEGGYFRIIRGTNDCGIEQSGVAGLPKL